MTRAPVESGRTQRSSRRAEPARERRTRPALEPMRETQVKGPGVRYEIGLPQTIGVGGASVVRRFAVRAESLGFRGLWTLDDVFTATPFLDGIQLLAFAAAVTSNVRLGLGVLVLPRRNPALLAKELSTLDVLSEGRLIAGFGVGHADPQLDGVGFPADRLLARTSDAIDLVKALWTEPRASYAGPFWDLSGVAMEPKPVSRPHPPIWLGVGGPRGLRLTARVADGWIGAGSSSLAQFGERLALLRGGLIDAGRDPAAFPVAKRVYIAVESDRSAARARLAPLLDTMYGTPGLTERVAVYGSSEDCAGGLRAVVAAGATCLVLNPLYDHEVQLEKLARVVALV